jgi:hypothetical protein
LYGKEDAVQSAHFKTGHNYNRASREAVYAFFGTHLQGATASVEERATVPAKEDLLWGSADSADEEAAVLAAWKQRASAGLQGISAEERRERLSAVLGVQWPERVDALLIGDRLVLQRAGSGDRVPAVWQPGRGQGVTVVVDAGGIDAGRKNARAKELAAAGEGLLYVRPFRTGGGGSGPRHDLEYLTFHRSDDANRVQDIVSALAYVEDESVRLVCPGRAGAWCALAAAVSPKAVVLEVDAAGHNGGDRLILPGLQTAGLQ